MEKLNEKVSDKYCDICGCNIKDRSKHLLTRKHQKELKDTYKVCSEAMVLKVLMDNVDVNNNKQVDDTINILKQMMNK